MEFRLSRRSKISCSIRHGLAMLLALAAYLAGGVHPATAKGIQGSTNYAGMADEAPALLATANLPPYAPKNLSPANGTTVKTYTPTLQASAFYDPNAGDTLLASQWQVALNGQMTSITINQPLSSGDRTHLAIDLNMIGFGMLHFGKKHYWRVRYQDQSGAWSDWSAVTSFIYPTAQPPAKPVNLSPANGAISNIWTPTLTCSPYSTSVGPDTPASAQWQVNDTPDFATPLWDSYWNSNHLTSHTVPDGLMRLEKSYYWRVRHQNAIGLLSDWSAPTKFTMSDVIPSDHWGNFFPVRAGQASVVFNDKIWVIGPKDAWSSADGKNWKFRSAIELSSSVGVIHNGAIWVLDLDDYYERNSIWRSDGETDWSRNYGNSPFSFLDSYALASFLSKIWLIGGAVHYYGDTRSNEIWTSGDGTTWTLSGTTPFAGRDGHTCTVFNNRLFLIGGAQSGQDFDHKVPLNDVWSTADGNHWRLETAAAQFPPRSGHACVVHNNRLWVIGGEGLADVWSSADGRAWTQATAAAPFGPRSKFSCVAFHGRLWVLAGTVVRNGSEKPMNDVWSSADGVNWVKETGFTSIQDAIDQTPAGGEVVVPPGRYMEPLQINKNIVLRSQNPSNPAVVGSTIIDALYSLPDNHYYDDHTLYSAVFLSSTLNNTSMISGFSIWNGECGIVGNGSDVRITHNHFWNDGFAGTVTGYPINQAFSTAGGGVQSCNGLIDGNTFETCFAGAGGALYGCNGIIQNNLFINNLCFDLYLYYPPGRYFDMIGKGNTLYECAGVIRNNTIVTGDNPVQSMEHEDINQNHSVMEKCTGTFENNIVWPISTIPTPAYSDTNTTPAYCCIQDWTGGGTGNISADPRFASLSHGNYHLRAESPCIDAGKAEAGLATDFDGDPRGVRGFAGRRGDGSLIDIGADEFMPPHSAARPEDWSLYE